MNYFSTSGTWWLPDSAGQGVIGELTFSEGGIYLTVVGSLIADEAIRPRSSSDADMDWTLIPIIHGRTTEGESITLLQAETTDFQAEYGETVKVDKETYVVRSTLSGAHVDRDSFVEAQVEFDCLVGWLRPPRVMEWAGNPAITPQLRLDPVELAYGRIGDTKISIVARGAGTISGNEVNWRQQAVIGLEVQPAGTADIVENWVRPLQNLLIYVLGRPVRLTNFRLRNDGATDGDEWLTVHFDAVQPATQSNVDAGAIARRSAPTLFMFNDSPLSFENLLSEWFSLRTRLWRTIPLLNATHYVDFMFNEHRYSSIFQSAEALWNELGFEGRDKTPGEHAERVDATISALQKVELNEATLRWAKGVLQSRNDKPLRQRILELTASTGDVGAVVLSACPNFPSKVVNGRTAVSHGGVTDGLDSAAKYWLGDVLRWIIRTRLLIALGVPPEETGRRISSKPAFRYAVTKLRNTIA